MSGPILFLQSNQHSSVYIFASQVTAVLLPDSDTSRTVHTMKQQIIVIYHFLHHSSSVCLHTSICPFSISTILGTIDTDVVVAYVIQLTCSSLAQCWNSFCCRDPWAQTVGMGMGVPIAQFGWPMWLPVPVQGVQVFCRYRSRYNQKYPGVTHADHYLSLLGICPKKIIWISLQLGTIFF